MASWPASEPPQYSSRPRSRFSIAGLHVTAIVLTGGHRQLVERRNELDGIRTTSTPPVILIPCLRKPVVPPAEALPLEMRGRPEAEIAYVKRIRSASIYPAIQNLILACRALGLGTTITTNHLRCEDEVRTLLRIPEILTALP